MADDKVLTIDVSVPELKALVTARARDAFDGFVGVITHDETTAEDLKSHLSTVNAMQASINDGFATLRERFRAAEKAKADAILTEQENLAKIAADAKVQSAKTNG